MTTPDPRAASSPVQSDASTSPLLRAAIWVAIGALIAAAIVCVVWVLVGSSNGIVGRAFLTILLLAAFAGIAILDAHLAPRRPAWFALASMASWVLALLLGAVLIWMPERYSFGGLTRFVQFLLIVLILQLLLLHIRLYLRSFQRYVTAFTQTVAIITIILTVGLAGLLIVPLVIGEYVDFSDLYWRIVVAIAILAAVGSALIPLVNVLFAPKKTNSPQTRPAPGDLLPWPMHIDGVTPLPMMPDGSPDWGAYYTGHATPGAHVFATPTQATPAPAPTSGPLAPSVTSPTPAALPGYEGYPPPPPLPPRP
jgi:hypothetical protein